MVGRKIENTCQRVIIGSEAEKEHDYRAPISNVEYKEGLRAFFKMKNRLVSNIILEFTEEVSKVKYRVQ